MFDGFGKLITPSWMYEGYFKLGKRHGRGVLWTTNGEIYEGFWFDDLKHGNGRCIYADKSIYEGQWSKGKWEGSGRMIWPLNDLEYWGTFKRDKWIDTDGWYSYNKGTKVRSIPKSKQSIEAVIAYINSPIIDLPKNVEIISTPEISPHKINPFFKIKFEELKNKLKPV